MEKKAGEKGENREGGIERERERERKKERERERVKGVGERGK